MAPTHDPVRATIVREAAKPGRSLRSLSLLIGRNEAYLHQYVHKGSPRVLPEVERRHLAIVLEVDECELGAREPWRPVVIAEGLPY